MIISYMFVLGFIKPHKLINSLEHSITVVLN